MCRISRDIPMKNKIRIVVNGDARECADSCSLEQLIGDMGLETGRAAVLVNDNVVSAKERARFRLREGDRVEILVFAGGG